MDVVLLNELKATLAQINAQMDRIRKDEEAARVYPMQPSDIYGVRYSNGTYVLPELLLAKAQVLNGIATLKGGSK